MMGTLWVVLLVALTGSHLGQCSPLRSTQQTYPHDALKPVEGWGSASGLYAVVPALAFVLTAVGLLFGCTWCYRHKDCKLFTASATHLHDGRRSHPPDSGFSEPVNNNIREDNNNGPISLREMQNIANNNATAYIVSENEERNRVSRESVVEFEPLPSIRVADPLEHCADWFGDDDFPRDQLQYLREIGRGWFGRVVEGEIEDSGRTTPVAVKILNQNTTLEDKARFLDEARMFRDVRHENVLAFIAKCLQEEPWILLFDLCSMDLQQYLIANRPKMAILNESGTPLRLMCDVSAGLAHLHSRGYLYGNVWTGSVLTRGEGEQARALLGRYGAGPAPLELGAPETRTHPPLYTCHSDTWSLGSLVWAVCAWGASPPAHPPPLPDLPCPYRDHLCQVMQLCWHPSADARPTASQVHALITHLYSTHREPQPANSSTRHSADFEQRWLRLKPNSIPTRDEHRAIVHAPSTSSRFTGSDDNVQTIQDSLSIDMDTAISRSSSIMSDRDPLSVQIKSESLTNLHGSLEDVRNIYLTHNETATLECHQGNIALEESREKEQDRSDSSMDPWLKDIIAGSQDDVSYFKDVSDVIKNLDNILNSEKTSSSESSHQASPSRDNLSLDCKKDYQVPSSMVKSPGIINFQSILDAGFSSTEDGTCEDDELDRDTIGTLSHSFERHSELDSTSQHTLENLTPDTPVKDVLRNFETAVDINHGNDNVVDNVRDTELPNEIINSLSEIPNLKELCVASIPSASVACVRKDCQTSCDNNVKSTDDKDETKSIDDVGDMIVTPHEVENKVNQVDLNIEIDNTILLPKPVEEINSLAKIHEDLTSAAGESLTTDDSLTEVLDSDLMKERSPSLPSLEEEIIEKEVLHLESEKVPESVQTTERTNVNIKENELHLLNNLNIQPSSPETVQSNILENVVQEEKNENTSSNDHFLRENIIDDMENNDIKYNMPDDGDNSEELNNDVQTTIDSEEKTTLEVKEYTKWINCGSFPQTLQVVSDFLHLERQQAWIDIDDRDIPDKHKNNITMENQVECSLLQEPIPQTLVNEHPTESVDFLEDIYFKKSLQDVHEEQIKNEIIVKGKDTNNTAESKLTSEDIELSIPVVTDTRQNIEFNSDLELITGVVESINENSENIDTEVMCEVECKTANGTCKIRDENELIKDIALLNDQSEKEDSVKDKSMASDEDLVQDVIIDKNKIVNLCTIERERVKEIMNDSQSNGYTNLESDVPLTSEQLSEVPISLYKASDINDTNTVNTIDCEKEKSNISLGNGKQDISDNSTVYMDLISDSNNGTLPYNTVIDNNVVINSYLENIIKDDGCSLVKNDSTEYLDLPSFGINEVDKFLQMEKVFNSNIAQVTSSTPLASDNSNNASTTLENAVKENSETEIMIPDYGPGVTLTKLEQKFVPDNLSPFESPTKSHPTDTYDENSSVVLGPFENCTLELFKCVKSADIVDLPKEELLAFSSNFSEINLETPSPLRDVNFLHEVPDIAEDYLQFDDIENLSDKPPSDPTETDSGNSCTEKRMFLMTPPNSPGVIPSTSQQKYIVNEDFVPEPESLQNEIELNQIELQITSKLAMAENENNMNIEYSGPLTVEGLVSDDVMLLRESDALPESYLAGNGGSVEDLRQDLTLDEECVKALRNELELKLPLAQVASIEPTCEGEGSGEGSWVSPLPPPPELVVSYPGALSPIAEETGLQLCAYENDLQWNISTRTDSSESYPEPCNNSTDEPTELRTGVIDPCPSDPSPTPHDPLLTYTINRDIVSSRELTMSADSLNASPYKKPMPTIDIESPIDDKTYTKEDAKEEEKVSLERISQVSPFLLSPTTDTSAPDNSDNIDNATGVSTLSKTTLPTDAKHSKPSDTQCLSKATSIDSWCSNDTLYNVEENFDDLAMDPDVPDFEHEKDEANSESTDTLTHNEEEKEASHCSTYIVHDSKSDACDSFSPDSITANDNYTYTKAKTDHIGRTPSLITTEYNDSTKNTPTKDLAYGTLMSGLPSYSNCTTEIVSGLDDWKMPQPELVRKSPMTDIVNVTTSNTSYDVIADVTSPQFTTEPCIKKMESVEITCLEDNLTDCNKTDISETQGPAVQTESPNSNYKNMAPSVTSTPLTELIDDALDEPIPMILPEVNVDSVTLPNLQMFLQSAEVRPQDLSSNGSNNMNQEGETDNKSRNSYRDSPFVSDRTPTYSDFENSAVSKPQDVNNEEVETDSKSRISYKDSLLVSDRTPTYSDFENSAVSKPQDVNVRKSSQSYESGIILEDFQRFESSVKSRSQDLSSLIDASSLLLRSERMSSEMAMSSTRKEHGQTSQEICEQSQPDPPNVTNLNESHSLVNFREPNVLLNFEDDDDNEQPHSIIITETAMESFKECPTRNYETDTRILESTHPYEAHSSTFQEHDNFEKFLEHKINGDITKSEEQLVNNANVLSTFETSTEKTDNDKTDLDVTTPSLVMDISVEENVQCNGGSEKFATVNFISEPFEELLESNVDESENKDSYGSIKPDRLLDSPKQSKSIKDELQEVGALNGVEVDQNGRLSTVTEDFLQNEKKFCQLDTYLPLLSDIRFTGPASEIMSTSFTQDSPTEPTSGECGRMAAAEIIKEWDSDSDSHTSNSSSGEFIWKDGDGHETSVVPTTQFEHQRAGVPQDNGCTHRSGSDGGAGSGASDASGDSGSGSEGDEVEFVPSSWDCRAAPAKSSLRSLEQTTPDNKKRVVFKRQKYHCVYEYPRETPALELEQSPAAYLPDLSTYSEWDPVSAEEAELGYGQLFGAPSPLDMYPLRAGIAFGPDYDEDFFISSSARPFESLGIMTSQFFPGKHIKPSLLDQDLSDDVTEEFPPPPSPLPTTTLTQTRTPSLDFTTPDSGVEDITPGSTTDEEFKKKLPESELIWRPVDSGSSSESVSPSSPGGEALGGLRHTRDKLKLDLPPSPHIPSPRHSRVFNFVLDKPKRREERSEVGSTPLVMTDDTPLVTTALPLPKDEDLPIPEPTFSTFGKTTSKIESEQKLILTDEVEGSVEVKVESPKVVEPVKGEGTVLDSGDEDSGIESSSKATLERNKTNVQ